MSGDVRCFWFGHTPDALRLKADIHTRAFQCERCGAAVQWSSMPRRIRDKRDLVLAALAQSNQAQEQETPNG